ncbi:MlaC/ttg2D family ABC transporter substrate-binding protein [Neisseria elongata]|uniref:MlaC/ttg2D family ABC transporter substrate-binding protein n=1 Tax=Neisseria elongata TaxID=495 RepID=UPI0006659447|nr:ABC transporter substrate-binding protein [Neisseria elongata]
MYQQIVFAAATAILAPAAFAALEHPARQQVQQNIDTVLKIIKNQSLSEQQKIRQVEQYANRFLDYERLSAMAVGQPWRQFSPQQKQSFIAAFKEMVIGMYARSAMMGAEKADVRVLPKITTNGNKVDVYSEILTPSGKKYEVAYQLYQTGSQYKLYNIRVDGVSIVTVYRNQFVELVNQQGIDGMIETVRNKKLKKAG